MYLIDSIVKEFPDEYIHNFARNLVNFFADTFTNAWVFCELNKVLNNCIYWNSLNKNSFKFYSNAKERSKLYELRSTWDDVFQPKILYSLDIKVTFRIALSSYLFF